MSKIYKVADMLLIGAGNICVLLFTGSVIRRGWAVQYVSSIVLAVLLFASLRQYIIYQSDEHGLHNPRVYDKREAHKVSHLDVNQLRIPIIALHGTFTSHPDPLSLFPSRRYAHYNVDGHQLVGSEIVPRLAVDGGPIASTHASQAFTSELRQAHH